MLPPTLFHPAARMPPSPADIEATSAEAAAGPPGDGKGPGEGEGPGAPFIKLAMRNMVRKGRQSLVHFGLTAVGLTAFLVLVAWLGRPHATP
jgi:hypothetical protein